MNLFRRCAPSAVLIALTLIVGSLAVAREAIVTMRDGRQYKGEVVAQNPTTITLVISNIKTPIPRAKVKSIEFLKTPEEWYRQARAKTAKDDVEGRYKIARELFDRKAYTLARKELLEIKAIAPDNSQVSLLLRVVEAAIKSSRPDDKPTVDTGDNTDKPKPKDGNDDKPLPPGALPKDRITEKDINKIRVYEIDLKAKPKVVVPRDVRDEFIKKYEGKIESLTGARAISKFKAAGGVEQLQTMFEARAREFYSQVVVRDDPPTLRTFKTRVHRNYVLNYCGTVGCHGGPKAGPMFLFREPPARDDTVYTNFYILHKYENGDGYMVDRDQPARSLLLTFGLPDKASATPHPQVPGWRPAFRTGTSDRNYQATLAWIKTLYVPKPSYDIGYKLPALSASKKPAKSPDDTDTKAPGTVPAPPPAKKGPAPGKGNP